MCVAGATISAATVAARATKGRRLHGISAPQLYVTRGNHMMATQAGERIGEALAEVSHRHGIGISAEGRVAGHILYLSMERPSVMI